MALFFIVVGLPALVATLAIIFVIALSTAQEVQPSPKQRVNRTVVVTRPAGEAR